MAVLCMRIPCWITKVTDIHSEYVMFTAFRGRLYDRVSMLFLHICCLSCQALPQNYEKRLSASLYPSALPPVRMKQICSHLTKYYNNRHLSIFRKTVQNNQVSLKSGKNNDYFTWRPIDILIISNSDLLRMRNVSHKVVEEIKTHILCSITLFRKWCSLWYNVENFLRAGQTKDNNTAHAHCMLDT